MATKYLYCRVSTKAQIKGNSLEDQAKAMKKVYGDGVIVEEQYSGAYMNRPKLQNILNNMVDGDYLVVTKLDRLARTAREGLAVVEDLMARGCKIHVLNMGLLEDTATGKLLYQILIAFAEFERAMIIERTTAGKEIARQNPDYKEGRKPKYDKAKYDLVDMLREKGQSYDQIAAALDMSKSAVYRHCKKTEAADLIDEGVDVIQSADNVLEVMEGLKMINDANVTLEMLNNIKE